MRRPDKITTCTTPDCPGKHRARGLCLHCYHAARYQVRRKRRYAWTDLEARGLALPLMKQVRKRKRFDAGKRLAELESKPLRRQHTRFASLPPTSPPIAEEETRQRF